MDFGAILGARAVTIRILGLLFGHAGTFLESLFAGIFLVDFGCRPGGPKGATYHRGRGSRPSVF